MSVKLGGHRCARQGASGHRFNDGKQIIMSGVVGGFFHNLLHLHMCMQRESNLLCRPCA
jgi:hypothetical protein